MNTKLVSTKDYSVFSALVDELRDELGERFPVSMMNWCGIGTRPYPLKNWKVYLAQDTESGRPVGVCGFYQQHNEPAHKFWIGWLGVSKPYRRTGLGLHFLREVEREVRSMGATELWVHTDADNFGAIEFYKEFGMQLWGQFRDTGVEQASASEDGAVLWKVLG